MLSENDFKNVKLGRFRLNKEAVLSQEYHSQVRFIMGSCVILLAQYIPDVEAFEYTALSNLFDEISYGNEVPFYSMEIDIVDSEKNEAVLRAVKI